MERLGHRRIWKTSLILLVKWGAVVNDFDYDCLQKKRLAQQAKYRKRGSKSKKCTMSTDYMTQKQWKERNGAVVEANFNQPISWDTFKELSKGTQEEYLRHLMSEFGANATSLAMMFNVKPLTIRRYIQSNGLSIQFQVGHSMSSKQREAWGEFLRNGSVSVQETDLDNSALHSADTDTVQGKKMYMRRFSLSFEGDINVSAISTSLIQILGGEAKGEVEIICNLL